MLYKTTEGNFIDVYTEEGKAWLRLRIATLLGWTEIEPTEYYSDEYDGQYLVKDLEGIVPDGNYNNRWRVPDYPRDADAANKLCSLDDSTCQQWDYPVLDIHANTQDRNYGCRFVHSIYDSEIQYIVTNSYALSRCIAWLEYVEREKLIVDNGNE